MNKLIMIVSLFSYSYASDNWAEWLFPDIVTATPRASGTSDADEIFEASSLVRDLWQKFISKEELKKSLETEDGVDEGLIKRALETFFESRNFKASLFSKLNLEEIFALAERSESDDIHRILYYLKLSKPEKHTAASACSKERADTAETIQTHADICGSGDEFDTDLDS